MSGGLDKILTLSQGSAPAPVREDPAGQLVLAAASVLEDLFILLASDDDDGDDDSSGKDGGPGDTDDDAGHTGHATFKALKKKGVPDAQAAKMCAKADKRVKATAMVEAAQVALGGLACAQDDWVELTAFDTRAALALAGDAKSPYGDVPYADPGYQGDGKKRYPVDNEEHTRAAWSYINKVKNAASYTAQQLKSIKNKIKSAAKKHGIQISDGAGETVTATYVALAVRRAEALQAMHHGPFTGRHAHGHMHSVVAGEDHFHNNDSDHSRHAATDADGELW